MSTTTLVKQAIIDAGGLIANDEQKVEDITRLLARYENDQKRPLFTYCIVSGDKCAMTALALFDKRLKQYGSLFNLMTQYKGRAGRDKKTVEVVSVDGVVSRRAIRRSFGNTQRDAIAKMPMEEWIKLPPKLWPIWDGVTTVNAVDCIKSTKVVPIDLYLIEDITATTCIRTDIVNSKGCQACPYVLICKAPCRQFVTASGRKVTDLTPRAMKQILANPNIVRMPDRQTLTNTTEDDEPEAATSECQETEQAS